MAESITALPFERRHRAVGSSTWWGKAWLRSVEELAFEQADLKRGRAMARSGRFGAIAVEPGLAASVITTIEGETLLVRFEVARLSEQQWTDFAHEVARNAGHAADLLAGVLTPTLVEQGDEVGVEVIPGADGVDTACGCGAWAQPCIHALGLGVQLAWLIDADPFLLLLLRGCAREQLLQMVAGGAPELAVPDDTGAADDPGDAADRASAILALADEAPTQGRGWADPVVAEYDARIAALLHPR